MIYSIGYATKPVEEFLRQLRNHGVDAVADVRSVPYSKIFHDFHREALAESLREVGIRYIYLGDELGPRSKDPGHYDDNGQVQFDRLQRSTLFLKGIERLLDGLDKNFTIAMLCAEKDPATCHRSLLIAYYLKQEHGIDVHHIDHEGELEPESALEKRLMAVTGIVPDMLTAEAECIEHAWREQSRRVAYRKP